VVSVIADDATDCRVLRVSATVSTSGESPIVARVESAAEDRRGEAASFAQVNSPPSSGRLERDRRGDFGGSDNVGGVGGRPLGSVRSDRREARRGTIPSSTR